METHTKKQFRVFEGYKLLSKTFDFIVASFSNFVSDIHAGGKIMNFLNMLPSNGTVPVRVTEPAYRNVIVWRDLSKFPEEEILNSEKWLCLEYNAQSEEPLLNWVKRTSNYTIERGICFSTVAVFADYSKLNVFKIPALVGKLAQAGAMLNEISQGDNFLQAIKKFDDEMQESVNRSDAYDQERNKLFRVAA